MTKHPARHVSKAGLKVLTFRRRHAERRALSRGQEDYKTAFEQFLNG